MVLAAAALAVQRPDALLDGDQAKDELALMQATHFAQLLGSYSRYGFAHPGPAWYYALAPVYAVLGAHSWSFYAAVLVLQGVVAALIVVAAWRIAGPILAAVTAALVLLYVHVMGELVFRTGWPPFAPLLPMALFLLTAAMALAGSRLALVAGLITGSFLIQAHVGTTVLVAVLLAPSLLRLVVELWRGHSRPGGARARSPRNALLAGAGVLLVVLMWLPVVIDQAINRPGNLVLLWQFFTSPHDRHPYHEAISVVGQMLTVYPFGHLPPLEDPGITGVPYGGRLAVGLFLVLCAGLFLAGALLKDRFAMALGFLVALAIPVTILSLSDAEGPLYPYLLLWVSAFPLVLIAGWAALVLRARPWQRWQVMPLRLAPVLLAGGATISVILVTAVTASGFLALPSLANAATDPTSRPAWQLTDAALAADPGQSVRVQVFDPDRWPVADAVMLQLAKQGRPVTVNMPYVDVAAPPTGDERWELIIANESSAPRVPVSLPGAELVGRSGETDLYLRRLAA